MYTRLAVFLSWLMKISSVWSRTLLMDKHVPSLVWLASIFIFEVRSS